MEKEITAAIWVGHGKSTDGSWDPGTTYDVNNSGKIDSKTETEAGLMLPIVKSAVKYLKASGVKVITDAYGADNITSADDNHRNMISQVNRANEKKVDISVAVHCDWYKGASGTQPLYVSAEGKKLALAIDKAVVADMGIKSKGATKRTDLYELNATAMPCVIYETGSIKNDIKTIRKADAYGKAIAKGICNYLGVRFNEGEFKIRAKVNLIIRRGPSLLTKRVGVAKKGVYTIVETKGTRGKLKSGAGWVTITNKYCERL